MTSKDDAVSPVRIGSVGLGGRDQWLISAQGVLAALFGAAQAQWMRRLGTTRCCQICNVTSKTAWAWAWAWACGWAPAGVHAALSWRRDGRRRRRSWANPRMCTRQDEPRKKPIANDAPTSLQPSRGKSSSASEDVHAHELHLVPIIPTAAPSSRPLASLSLPDDGVFAQISIRDPSTLSLSTVELAIPWVPA